MIETSKCGHMPRVPGCAACYLALQAQAERESEELHRHRLDVERSQMTSVTMTKCVTCDLHSSAPKDWHDGQCERCQLRALRGAGPAVFPAASDVTMGLIRELRERDARGLAKYGTTLDRADLSFDQWMQHLLEEVLDAAGYIQAARREHANPSPKRCPAESNPYIGFCSLVEGHAGDHAAYAGHDATKGLLGAWA